VKKLFINMSDDEKKAALAEEKKQREDLFADLIEGAPQRKAEAEAAHRQELEARAAEKEVLFKQSVRESFIVANGSELGFDSAWPALREEIVRQRTLANVGNKLASTDLVERFLQQANNR
jgi:hypothetical protein